MIIIFMLSRKRYLLMSIKNASIMDSHSCSLLEFLFIATKHVSLKRTLIAGNAT